MLGRRGPVQAAFTPPELKELAELGGAGVSRDTADRELHASSWAGLEAERARARRHVDILRQFAATAASGSAMRLVLRFRVSPVAILGEGKVEGIEVVRNELVPDGRGSVRAVATEEREVIPCGIVFRSVGYRG